MDTQDWEYEGQEFGDPAGNHQHPQMSNDTKPMEIQNDAISTLFKCQSVNARKLCVYDVAYKLKHSSEYSIGGTYKDMEPEIWFYYTTSLCPGYNYLLNLFLCHRKNGNFSIGISSSNELTHKKMTDEGIGRSVLPASLTWYTFRNVTPDQHYYVKTFCFSEKDLKALENSTLFIPVIIDMNPKHIFNTDVIKRIKLNHDFGDLLSKQEKSDFILESVSGKKYQTHKIILAAHSSVLRNIIKNTKSTSAFIDISDNDMELLLQFIYTGAIKDMLKQDCLNLLEIANKFQLKNLFLLTQFAIANQIDVKNAVEIALISEKYKLEQLQNNVFNFIKTHPEVMETEGWKNLKDIDFAKKLFQFIHKTRD